MMLADMIEGSERTNNNNKKTRVNEHFACLQRANAIRRMNCYYYDDVYYVRFTNFVQLSGGLREPIQCDAWAQCIQRHTYTALSHL